mmetsp:Transcript_25066/g.72515  ORF Transcript_25066/g.72515 Transcript_25066/m.72515 type:complete len:652 (+) Transcript_25066:1-1956(+)
MAKGRKMTASVGASATASAAAAAEASSLAKAAAIAKLAEIQQQMEENATAEQTVDSSLARAASGLKLDGEEKKFDDEANDPARLNAETTKEISDKLAEMIKAHEANEAQWKEATDALEAKLAEQSKAHEELLQTKEEELVKSAEAITDLEQRLEAKAEEQTKAVEELLKERDGDMAKSKEAIAGLEKEIASLKEALSDKTQQGAEHTETIAKLQNDIVALEGRVKAEEAKLVAAQESFVTEKADLEAQVRDSANERRKLHNTIQELRGNVRVFARVRPFLPGDDAGADEQPAVVPKADDVSLKLRLKGDEKKEYSFTFDQVFKPDITQEAVFTEVSEFVQSALDGYNVCLFSYGQTGSGKTHTMQGSGLGDMRGIIPRAIERVGEYKAELEAQGWQYEMRVSFLEIYNETIRDLLRDEEIGEKKHEIKVNPDGSRLVTDLSIRPLEPTDADAVKDVMETAAKYRTVTSTNMNDVSSRSHSVFTLHLTAVHPESNQKLKGMLNLCDLAGSERLKRSGVSGDQAKEAMSINKSLSALTNVFVSIGSKAGHVPYRNSKLTWLLQPSLSGDGKTLMLCNLSPTEMSSQESLSSLRFASQVNQCELGQAKRSIQDAGSDNSEGGGKTPPRRSGSNLTSPPGSRLTRPTSSSSGTKK